jgi:glycosyltransferase involved in cell wall biosynthesis
MVDAAKRKTILVLAYSISPIRGSEYSVGWDYVRHMSKDNDLVVLYGLAGPHMGDFHEMEGVTPEQFGSAVTFVPVTPGFVARLLNAPNRAGRLVYSFYFAYRLWHREAFRVAQAICQNRQIDVVHYLCPIGFREPGYLWRLQKPYIWGPVGGLQSYSWKLYSHAGSMEAVKIVLRNAANFIQRNFSIRLRKAFRRADILIACSSQNADHIKDIANIEPMIFAENGTGTVSDRCVKISAGNPLRFIWVGAFEPRKALRIALRALATVSQGDWRLDIVGSGKDEAVARALSTELGIDHKITWHGQLPREKVLKLFSQADVHILSSLAEGNPTILWEAMSNGVPTVSFDHSGMHDTLCENCGVRIALIEDTVPEAVARLGDALSRLVLDREEVQRLAAGTKTCAFQHSWGRRIERWNQLYDRAILRYAERKM